MISFKIKDTEPCPCGSGEQFAYCCKGVVPNITQTKVPPDVQIMKNMRASMKKVCLHPDKARCKGKIKEAHALQNNKIISLLAGSDHHVYMLNPKKQPLLVPDGNGGVLPFVEVTKISANDATTETCFCDYHDNVAFAAIEKGAPDFNPNSEEMKFIYAYKAFVFEYYKQSMSMNIFRDCFKKNPPAFQDSTSVAIYRMLQMKMEEFDPVKDFFDNKIMTGTVDGLYTCVVKIPRQIAFADYAYIAPDYDMDGRKIKHTKKNIMHRIALTIFPEKNASWLIMSCLEGEKSIYEELFDQAVSASQGKLELYINMMLPLYSENMVLSKKLWESWDEQTQLAYAYYANLNGPDAKRMSLAIGMGLKNVKKGLGSYDNQAKLNLFAV